MVEDAKYAALPTKRRSEGRSHAQRSATSMLAATSAGGSQSWRLCHSDTARRANRQASTFASDSALERNSASTVPSSAAFTCPAVPDAGSTVDSSACTVRNSSIVPPRSTTERERVRSHTRSSNTGKHTHSQRFIASSVAIRG